MGSLKDFDLPKLKERFRLRVLVETGTGEGNSLRHAAQATHWDALHSIEVDPAMFEATWRTIPARSILWPGQSVDMLPRVIEQIQGQGPALFWLDAHFPGNLSGLPVTDEKDMSVRLPLEEELRAIVLDRDVAYDVFIIDDAWIYHDGVSECGDFDQRMAATGGISDGFITSILDDTHVIALDRRANGYTIAVPKLSAWYLLEECLGPGTSANLGDLNF